jgi:hypothetical protein
MDWGWMARAAVLCVCICIYIYIYIYICGCVCVCARARVVRQTEMKPRPSYWQRWCCMRHLRYGCVISQCRRNHSLNNPHTNMLVCTQLDLNLRKKPVKCYVWSIAVYGAVNGTLGSRSERPGNFWNVVLERDGEDQLDRPCDIWSIT